MNQLTSFIAVSDIHLGHKLYNLPELAEDLRENFTEILTIAIQKKVRHVVVVGDLYDDNQPKPDTIAFVRDQVKRLTAEGIQVIGIAGDHDKPINDETWCQVSDILPIQSGSPAFFGFDYRDYSIKPTYLADTLLQANRPEQVEFIFAHGQVPTLFKFTEDKKKLDFGALDIFKMFPNLKGIILGDIHAPLEGTISDLSGHSAFIGYCGSPGVIDASEAIHEKRILHYDGDKLHKIPYKPRRDYIKINFTGKQPEIFQAVVYVEKYKNVEKPPVFIVNYDIESKQHLDKLKALYDVGIVRLIDKRKSINKGEEETTQNIRSELGTKERIRAVLKECSDNSNLVELADELLDNPDPKAVLDKYKASMFKHE